MEIANAVEPIQDGRIFIELLYGPVRLQRRSLGRIWRRAQPAIERGWLWKSMQQCASSANINT
jgi:hypothetical protein